MWILGVDDVGAAGRRDSSFLGARYADEQLHQRIVYCRPVSSEPDAQTFDPAATGAVTTPIAPSPRADPPGSPRRFQPGTIIAGRYRLVAMLGRGGMGEVYRADDLTLDQPVALKFLPLAVGADERSLGRFHNELRVARQVAHPNVCRLYDIGEADGHRFLTMEYIDGEDLASLLRRIGRLPQDKAVQIARQLCAGVGAAHARGVLHRDLKPANVMIDGDGDARITDFGIATAAADTSGDVAGTPQYMAPELFAGQPASAQSDLYALGLTLYELFTGRRAYDSRTIAELKRLHESGTVTTPSAIIGDLDPAIERAILRCLDKSPARRPASALALAAMLPGGDALADALAAGETPSPALLAAAGEQAVLPLWQGLAIVAAVVAGVFVVAGLSGRSSIVGRTPRALPPLVLEDRARTMIREAGYTGAPIDEASGFAFADGYIGFLRNNRPTSTRWDALASGTPSGLRFWYRSSPREMEPAGDEGVTETEPPLVVTGMHLVALDASGRLQEFQAVPPQRDDSPASAPPVSWDAMFRAAGLEMAAFAPVAPQWTPRHFAEDRQAWEGEMPGVPGRRLRVEAASYRGRPVSFVQLPDWTRASLMGTTRTDPLDRVFLVIAIAVFVLIIGAAIVLARINLRSDRADRRSAARIAGTLGVLMFIPWLVDAHHLATPVDEVESLLFAAGAIVLLSGLLWVVYLALEPYVRRFWPHVLLGWSRLLKGHVRDPRVGRDVLAGVAFGVGLALCSVGRVSLLPWLGYRAPQPPFGGDIDLLVGAAPMLAQWIRWLFASVGGALLTVLAIVLLKLALRRIWPALAIAAVLVAASDLQYLATSEWLWVFALINGAIVAVLTLQFGLLTLAVARFVWYVLYGVPLTLDVTHWSATASNWSLALILALMCFGFYASRAGRLFGTAPTLEART